MLKINNISFAYYDNYVLKNIDFELKEGQNCTIIGESGCGKSTLLKLIYGIYDLNDGTISYNNNPILGPKYKLIPGEDYIKYLAQDFGLMPYITVAENVGKFLSNVDKNKKNARINELLEMVEMLEFAEIKAQYLSGGQQQRVALAMVLAKEPKILLLDEPFSQIDSFRKNTLRRNLFQYLKSKQISCIIATHDSNDVLSFSDKTIVLRNGGIIANDHPKILFENPKSKYIGSLFGEINEIENRFLEFDSNNENTVLVYSHQLKLTKNSDFKVVVKQNYYRGNYFLVEAIYNDKIMFFDNVDELEINSEVYLKYFSK